MFTGIVTAIGTEAVTDKGDRLLRISCIWDCGTIDIGASIACSGICLTVVNTGDHWFEVAASAETVGVTTLGSWQVGASLNLERALRLGDELGGHIVTGHVDGLARIRSITPNGDSHIVWWKPRWRWRLCSSRISGVDGIFDQLVLSNNRLLASTSYSILGCYLLRKSSGQQMNMETFLWHVILLASKI